MRVLVTGIDGQLGSALIEELKKRKIDFFAANRKNMNLEDETAVKKVISNYAPNFVYHCAAFTNVEKAEELMDYCYLINVLSTRWIAQICHELEAKLVYISTDFVFDGQNDIPYYPQDKPNPINFYGKSKYLGELEVQKNLKDYFIVRTSWVYGDSGNNFVNKILTLSQNLDELKIVSNEYGSPTYTKDLSVTLMKFLDSNFFGIYHICNNGQCSRYDFTKEIIKLVNPEINVIPIDSSHFSNKVIRPKYTVLNQEHNPDLSIKIDRSWQKALAEYLKKGAV